MPGIEKATRPRRSRTKAHGRAPLPRIVLLLAAAAVAEHAFAAAPACVEQLEEAKRTYQLGRFEQVLEKLEPCLKSGFSLGQAEEARALQAKTYLAMDELDKAAAAVATLLNLSPVFSPLSSDPSAFIEMVQQRKGGRPRTMISSVSKTEEAIEEAPATVIVLSAEEIARRGYLDLAAVLDDLPGFDISRGNGDIYSNFFQRGYRSLNDRTLFLVDGVEESDLWEGVAFLSRQFPLTHIERLEVVYGPASTMYGPNAFVGVINIITKEPEAFLDDGESFGGEVRIGGGSWDTQYVDATIAGRHRGKNIAYSLTVRRYMSDEADRSRFAEWDYQPVAVDYRQQLNVTDPEKATELWNSLTAEEQARVDTNLVQVDRDGDQVTAILLRPAGEAAARESDLAVLAQLVEGRPVEFTDVTETSFVYGKLRLANLTFGFEIWEREEGFNSWYTDSLYAGARNGTLWIPQQTFFYLKYERDLGPRLGLTFLSQFKRHQLTSSTREQQLRNYATQDLDILDLALGRDAYWRRTLYGLSNRQFKNELTLIYKRGSKLSVVSGVDARSSLLQGDFRRTVDCPNEPDAICPKGENLSGDRPEFFDQLDLGVYSQATYKVRERLKIVIGVRFDYNDVREVGGYGTVFNSRLAVIYSPEDFVFKAIYSSAFKDASNFNRYAVAPGLRDLPSPGLDPEEVDNFELAARFQVNPRLAVDVAAYRAEYTNAVAPQVVPFNGGTTLQNQAVGTLEITGLQASAEWQLGKTRLYGNYTFTDPRNTNPMEGGMERPDVDEVRVGDIAEHQLNLGFHASFWQRFDVNLRLNYVGDRETGENTTVTSNPLDVIDSYLVANLALAYRRPVAGLTIQLLVNNLFDEEYFHPGVNSADGEFLASRLPQAERSYFLRLTYDF